MTIEETDGLAAVPETAVENTAPQQAEPVETEQVEATATDDGADTQEPKKARGVQKRLDELTRLRHEAQRQAEYWREMAMRSLPQDTPPAPSANGRPTLEQFDFDTERHAEAVAEWKVTQLLSEREAQQEAARKQQTIQQKLDEARKKYADFDDVALDVPLSQAVIDALPALDNAGDVAYWLGSNPDDASRIARLSPAQAAIELGRISERISRPASPAPRNVPPAPIKPVTGNSGAMKAPEEMSMAEYIAWRNS